MNPFCILGQAEAEAQRRYAACKAVWAERPLLLANVWEARRAWERAEQRQRQARTRLDRWRHLRWERVGPALAPVEAGRRRLSWKALKKAIGDVGLQAAGLGPWLLAIERVSRASRKAGDRWSFSLAGAIRQALTHDDDLRAELLRLPVEQVIRLVRTYSPWAATLKQAARALALWAEERRLEREAGSHWDVVQDTRFIAVACHARHQGAPAAGSADVLAHCR